MGGIPTDIHARVTRDAASTVVPGLYAAGECACVSVHGANRLGTNSLVDLLVFGRRAGRQMALDVAGVGMPELARDVEAPVRAEMTALKANTKGENAARIRKELADVMMDNVGVYRDEALLSAALPKVRELKQRYAKVGIADRGSVFNTDLLEAREVGYLLDCAETTVVAALNRKESRGSPCPRGLSRPRRRQLPDPQPRDPRSGRRESAADLQTGHDHPVPAQAADLLSTGARTNPCRSISASSATTPSATRSRTGSRTPSSPTRRRTASSTSSTGSSTSRTAR